MRTSNCLAVQKSILKGFVPVHRVEPSWSTICVRSVVEGKVSLDGAKDSGEAAGLLGHAQESAAKVLGSWTLHLFFLSFLCVVCHMFIDEFLHFVH